MTTSSHPSQRDWLLYAVAALSFVPTLWFYYVGEEAIFPISSLEMWQQSIWLKQTLYGTNLLHNPLLNWLTMPLAELVGWRHVLEVTRALAVTATLTTGLVMAWLCHRLWRDRAFAAFAALVYVTLADLLLYRGWLAYVDTTFMLFTFAAIALLWVATIERRTSLLALAAAALTLAFLSKALTAYVFYGTAVFVLLWRKEQRVFLLGLPALLLHAIAYAFPLLWFRLLPESPGQGGRMLGEIADKLVPRDLAAYAWQLTSFPLETALRLSPALLLALYFAWKRHKEKKENSPYWETAFWITLLNYLPYWLAPHSSIRYVLPLYPLFALILAWPLWQAGTAAIKVTQRWLSGVIAFKFIFVLVLFPYYQHSFRGENYYTTAQDIITLTQGQPLYVTDGSASGLSVAGYIDALIYPRQALHWPPAQWESGFVIAYTADEKLGQVYKKYMLGGNELYLLCRGQACN
ncbi:MAG: dolichyl-phosphate-mannose--protein mannosyltransferase [Pseudomonadota bacterium]